MPPKLTSVRARGRQGVAVELDGVSRLLTPAEARELAGQLEDANQAAQVRRAAVLVEAAQASAARLDRTGEGGRVLDAGTITRTVVLDDEHREARRG